MKQINATSRMTARMDSMLRKNGRITRKAMNSIGVKFKESTYPDNTVEYWALKYEPADGVMAEYRSMHGLEWVATVDAKGHISRREVPCRW